MEMENEMKKTMTLLLCFILLLTAVGCGGQDNKDETTDYPVPTRGSWSGESYTNEYAGLKLTLAEGWEAIADASLASMMRLAEGEFAEQGQPYTEAMQQIQLVTEMICVDGETGASLTLSMENLSLVENGLALSADYYFEIKKQQIEDTAAVLADPIQDTDGDDAADTDAGGGDYVPDYTFSEVHEQTVSGKTYKMMSITDNTAGTVQYLYARRHENYMIEITVITTTEGDIAAVMSMFS